MFQERSTRRGFLRDMGRLGLAITGAAAFVAACDTKTTIVKVDQDRLYQELGLRGNIPLVDLRILPQYSNAPGGFVVHESTEQTPEPFSQTRVIKKLKFAWRANTQNSTLIVSDVNLEKVRFAEIAEGEKPFVNFDLLYDLYDRGNDPNYYVQTHLNSATFHMSTADIQNFRGDQNLLIGTPQTRRYDI